MARTVDLSLSVRTRQYVAAVVVSYFAAVATFWWVGHALGTRPDLLVYGGTFVGCCLLSVLWVRWRGDDEDGDVWSAVPRRQYAGRFAESGGVAREEQEQALDGGSGPDEDR